MGNTYAIMAKEVKSYLNSPIAYLFAATFLGILSYLFFMNFFLNKVATVAPMFANLPLLYSFFLPGLTMRLWAEEKKVGTLETLITMPVKNWELIFGKFSACLGLLLITLLLTLPIPVIVNSLHTLDPGPVIGGYLGSLLLGAAIIAIGIFFSSITENQFVALILTWLTSFFFVFLGFEFITSRLPFVADFSLQSRFINISQGVVDSRDVLYYLSFTGLFLALNFMTLELRRWR